MIHYEEICELATTAFEARIADPDIICELLLDEKWAGFTQD
jgi:hypothetical protein